MEDIVDGMVAQINATDLPNGKTALVTGVSTTGTSENGTIRITWVEGTPEQILSLFIPDLFVEDGEKAE